MTADAKHNLNQTGPRWLPAVLGLITALVYWWVWGALVPLPAIHDESAYLLQADIFAGGHWTAPGRPLPEFFEQFHVLVTPVLAAKYPPGHSLLLSLGELLRFPAFVPLLLNGLTGALTYLLAARLADPLTGALTWLFWLLAPMNLTYRPSYLSNVTTGALWVAGWWALLKWWESGERRWLLVLAACVGWCVITRPLTGLVLALPVAVVVMRRVWQRGLWTDLGFALALGTGVVAILPLANQQTTGHWLEMPWMTYSRQYMPYDHLGFGLDSTPALRAANPELAKYNAWATRFRRSHTIEAIPRIAGERLWAIVKGTWGNRAVLLLPLALVGVVMSPKATVVGLNAAGLLVLAHLAYGYPPHWTVYYLEIVPVLAFLTAVGIVRLGTTSGDLLRLPRVGRSILAACIWALAGAWLVEAVVRVPAARRNTIRAHAPRVAFAGQLSRIPVEKSIVFVRYPPYHSPFRRLIVNQPDLDQARIWLVHDRGADNARLLALAPERVPFLYDESRRTLLPLADATKAGEPGIRRIERGTQRKLYSRKNHR
jgi:Dolichyl-phosphate-mannose-protein mannosyltransferase